MGCGDVCVWLCQWCLRGFSISPLANCSKQQPASATRIRFQSRIFGRSILRGDGDILGDEAGLDHQ